MSPPSEVEKFDPALMGILQHVNSIDGFLDVMFSFLMRKTDFFRHPTENNPKFGFPPGKSLKMVQTAHERYKKILEDNLEKLEKVEARPTPTSDKKPQSNFELPIGAPQAVNKDENGPIYLADSECYNGANRERYSWSQSLIDLEINVKLPEGVTAKQLSVSVQKDHIKVATKSGETIFIDERLCWPIKKTEEYQWYFDKNKVVITCDKQEERWWDALFTTEEKIDTQKIDCSRPMSELSEEAQAHIAKMQYDQLQKQKGLPTSEEQNIHNILKDAWNKEGSPFQGTPFDPSSININTSS